MKKVRALFVSLFVIFAAFFSVVTCVRGKELESGPGSLTITGFPAEYNGHYAVFCTSSMTRPGDGYYLVGTANPGNLEGALIRNGSVIIPVYLAKSFNEGLKPTLNYYHGNDRDLLIFISVKPEKHFEDYDVFVLDTHVSYVLNNVSFTGGRADALVPVFPAVAEDRQAAGGTPRRR
jgi:hypothetical protein